MLTNRSDSCCTAGCCQDDEPCPDPERNPQGMPSMRKADMVLTVEAGLLPEMTGGYDAMAEIRQALAAARDVPG